MPKVLTTENKTNRSSALPVQAWAELSSAVQRFDPDVVILVARKMPRLVDALGLNFGPRAVAISDQAIPFVLHELKDARVAIVDDVWNVGTTMLHARDRALNAGPRTIKLFALAAKDAESAQEAGVNLVMLASLSAEQRRSFIESVPRALRLASKPFDVDFPIIQCLIRAPYRTWEDCWAWLQAHFGELAHCTVDDAQLSSGLARATVNLRTVSDWIVKARLYFDLRRGFCNVVPMALAPSLPLRNDYPSCSLPQAVFDALSSPLHENSDLKPAERNDGLARVNTFCDSLLFSDDILNSVDGLLQREAVFPFTLGDTSLQFGPHAAEKCKSTFGREFGRVRRLEIEDYLSTRSTPSRKELYSLLEEKGLIEGAIGRLREGFPSLALDALLTDLAKAVGADNPREYSLSKPYTSAQIKDEPYLRLRLGYSYRELVEIFRHNFDDVFGILKGGSTELLVSSLMDAFIDQGAIVPTFPMYGTTCVRIYRKGEANPRWDEEIARLQFALASLKETDRKDLLAKGRTRIAKINAILALSSATPSSLNAASLERGTVGSLMNSVVERHGGDLTGLMRRLGLLK